MPGKAHQWSVKSVQWVESSHFLMRQKNRIDSASRKDKDGWTDSTFKRIRKTLLEYLYFELMPMFD